VASLIERDTVGGPQIPGTDPGHRVDGSCGPDRADVISRTTVVEESTTDLGTAIPDLNNWCGRVRSALAFLELHKFSFVLVDGPPSAPDRGPDSAFPWHHEHAINP